MSTYGNLTLCDWPFHVIPLISYFIENSFSYLLDSIQIIPQPSYTQRLAPYTYRFWTDPCSLVTTEGVSYDFLSSCYWDISLRRLATNMAIRIADQVVPFGDFWLIAAIGAWPELFATNHVLLLLLYSRHPPLAFKKLTCLYKYIVELILLRSSSRMYNDSFARQCPILYEYGKWLQEMFRLFFESVIISYNVTVLTYNFSDGNEYTYLVRVLQGEKEENNTILLAIWDHTEKRHKASLLYDRLYCVR